MSTPSIQTLRANAQQVLNLDSISAVRSVVAAALANANGGTPLNPNLTTQQLWNEFYQIVTQPKSDIESIIANQLMKFLYAPPAPGGVGADKQVIFNDGGVLAGGPQFLWNKTTNLLTVTGSATITGDLTVDTNTLKVDSANNRVGVLNAAPNDTFTIASDNYLSFQTASTGFNSGRVARIGAISVGSGNGYLVFETYQGGSGGAERYRIAADGVATWSNVGGVAGTAMTLNATGLGVGVVSANGIKLSSFATTDGAPATSGTTQTSGSLRIGATSTTGAMDMGTAGSYSWIQVLDRGNLATNYDLVLQKNGGNVGIGVQPSAWSGNTAIQLKNAASSITGAIYQGANGGANANGIAYNCYFDGTNWNYILGSAHPASRYQQAQGIHQWHIAPSSTGTAAFTQAMTLDASGNLMVASTSTSLTTGTGLKILQNSGVTTVGTVGSSSSDVDTTYRLYSSTASAYRFYVGYGGTVYATNTTISAISDARLKENVQDIDVGLGAILALKPRKFDWKAGKGKDIKGDRGFIAQEFEQVFPQLVDEWADPAPEGEAPYKSVRQDLIPVLVKAIQELTARVQTLEAK